MNFKNFNSQIKNQFQKMCQTGKLFRADVSGNDLWNLYLSSFENERVFRDPESSEHNCNHCKNFIRRYGNVVSIGENGMESIFTGINNAGEYTIPAQKLNNLVLSRGIQGVFFETYRELNENLPYESCNKNQSTYKLGVESNFKKYTQDEVDKFGVVNTEDVYEFNHFCVVLPKQFVDFSGRSIENLTAHYRDKCQVFKRAMEEIPLDTLNLVKDLIKQGSLLDGNAHFHVINEIIEYKKKMPLSAIDNWCWDVTYNMDERIAKFKNTLIGTLCTELAEGEELNSACFNWNKRVDPVNYHKATAPITKRQIEEAKRFVEENGYTESFDRRLATIDDIKTSEILHLNAGDGSIGEVSIFDNIKPTSTQHKRSEFKNIDSVSIEKFMSDILPSCTSVEVYIENRMEGNLVTLTTSKQKDAKQITKWNNIATNYSWTFNGNLAGKSQIKEAVSSQGGKVDGVLRFSIMWAEDNVDNSDLDAHCKEPTGNTIYYSNTRSNTGGWLDIDITQPQNHGKDVVENISYPSLDGMKDGVYKFMVHQFAERGSKGFKAEIEFNGEIYSYEYNKPLANKNFVSVAEVTLKNGELSINHKLPETSASRKLWGVETNKFHKVNLVCKSPNHWGDNSVGNLHYFFMVDGCEVNAPVRGFHNENLTPDLLKHRKVMEVLGATKMIKPGGKQLSGIGFNSTVRDELIVKCKGNFKRTLKVKF